MAELLITLSILGILMSFAIPTYQTSTQKTRKADAQGAILVLSNKLERYFTANNTYAGAVVSAGDHSGYYQLSIVVAAESYSITATPQTGQADYYCGDLTLTSTGVKSAVKATVAQTGCW